MNKNNESRTINENTEAEYKVDEFEFDHLWDVNDIVNCVGCGRWFDISTASQNVREIHGEPFDECPVCHKNMITGETEVEFAENAEREYEIENPVVRTSDFLQRKGE